MISEQTLIFSGFVVIVGNIKRVFFPSNLHAFVYINNVSTNIWYLHQYLSSNCQLYSRIFKQLPFTFATTISYPYHISLNPPLATQFSRHILSKVFDQSFHISGVFQNPHLVRFCLPCHVLIIYTCTELQAFAQHLFRNVFTVVSWTVSTPCERTYPRGQWDRNNVLLASHNSV